MFVRRCAMALMSWVLVGASTGCSTNDAQVRAEDDPLVHLRPNGVEPKVLRYGVTPSAGADTAEQLAPLLQFLSRQLGIPVEGVTATDYGQLEELFRAGDVNVGQFSPAAYVAARGTLPGVMLATATNGGSPSYMSYFMARKSLANTPLADFRGKRVAWVHRSSTSGYVFPRWLLCNRGYQPDDFFADPPLFTGDHATSATALREGKVDIAAVASNFVDQEGPSGPIGSVGDLVVIAKSARIPLDGVVIHNSVARGFGKRLRAALLHVAQEPAVSRGLTRSWGVNGFVAARPGHYQAVENVMAEKMDRCR